MEGDDGKVIINVRPSSRPSVPESRPVGFLRALMIPVSTNSSSDHGVKPQLNSVESCD